MGQIIFIVLKIVLISSLSAANSEEDFNAWLSSYKKIALKKGISQETIDTAFKNVKFLEKVIKYDRKQPEFYEDTITYISKRVTSSKIENGSSLYKKKKINNR